MMAAAMRVVFLLAIGMALGGVLALSAFLLSDDEATPVFTETFDTPERSLLAYQSDLGGDHEIFVTRVGERPRQLTRNRVADRLPSWSADGRRILFVRSTPDGVGSYYLMNADGSNQQSLGRVRTTKPPWSAWARRRSTSPDGEWTVFGDTDGYSGIYIGRTDGTGKPRKVTDLYSPDPSWSTDGRWISFWTRDLPGGKVTSSPSLFNLWAVSPDGANETLVARQATRGTWQP
jgi:Tol biopolymer transport system component